WLLSTALKSGGENIFAYPPNIIPEHLTFKNFVNVLSAFPFWSYLFHSVVVRCDTILLNIVFCSRGTYHLSQDNFNRRDLIFILILCTYMLPFQLLMVPIYILSVNLGLQNSYAGLVLPHLTTAFGIFLMRQAFSKVPDEMEESARMDGANSLQIWWRIL